MALFAGIINDIMAAPQDLPEKQEAINSGEFELGQKVFILSLGEIFAGTIDV